MAAEADKSNEDHSTSKGNYKTDLTLTGLLMEGLGPVILSAFLRMASRLCTLTSTFGVTPKRR